MRFFVAVFFAFVMLAGCDNHPAHKNDIVMLIKGQSNPYWKVLAEGATEAAKEKNIAFTLQTVINDQDAEQQLNLCETIFLNPPKALVFAAVNNTNLVPCLQKAKKAGIVLVDVDGSFTKEEVAKLDLPVVFSVASNNEELGKKAAEYLQNVKGNVLVIEGLAGSGPGQLRLQGFKANLGTDKTIVASLPGDWDRLKAANITNDVIVQHSDLAAVFAANDMMALGAAEALRAKGMTGVKVVGIDGVADAVKAIGEGTLTASIAQLPYLMGRNAVLKTAEYLEHPQAMDYSQYVDVVTLDKDVLTAKKDALLNYVR